MGQEQARKAGQTLVEKGVGRAAMILTTPLKRTVETATIINEEVGRGIVAPEQFIGLSFHPYKIRNLDETLDFLMQAAGCTQEPDHDLIAVTHEPLIARAACSIEDGLLVRGGSVDFGQVYEYEPMSWVGISQP